MSKKTIYISLAIVAVAVLTFVYFNKKSNKKGTEIEVATAKKGTIIETVSGTGKIQPEIEVKIASMVSGEIIALPIKEGQVVKKGDLLVKINPDLYTSSFNRTVAGLSQTKAGLNQADAQFEEAQKSFARSKTLFDKGIISKSEWDKAQASFDVAKATKESAYYNVKSAAATVSEAKENLGRTIIYSPADGTISKLAVELGERVLGTQQMAGTELMTVANLNNMEVEVDVNENDIVKINIGDSAKVSVDAYAKKEFRGLVTNISNAATSALTADQVTNFKVKVRILKSSYEDLVAGKPATYSPFRPGMTATVDIMTKRIDNIISIPISSVVVRSDTLAIKKTDEKYADKDDKNTPEAPKSDKRLECVFVKNGNKARIRIIKTGIQDDANIEVISGLKEGDIIITGPYNTVTKELNSGDLVTTEKKKE